MGKMYLNGILYGVENRFKYDLLLENTNFTPTSGTSGVTRTYTLKNSIDEYDAIAVFGFMYCATSNRNQITSMLIMNQDLYWIAPNGGNNSFMLNGTISSAERRILFRFTDSTHIATNVPNRNDGEEPRLWKVYGLKFPSDDQSARFSDTPIYLGSQLLYKDRISTNSTDKTDFFCDNYYNGTADHISKIAAHVVVPNGYEIQYRISALLNSQSTNQAQIYINDVLMISGGTYIGSQPDAYLNHFGETPMSNLFRFSDIPTEIRYIVPASERQGYNFSLASSVSGQTAWAENVTIHAYLVKTGGYYVDENDQVYTDENGNRYSDIYG